MDKRQEILDKSFQEAGIKKGWIEESNKAVLKAMQDYADHQSKDDSLINKITNYLKSGEEIIKSFSEEDIPCEYEISLYLKCHWHHETSYHSLSWIESNCEYSVDYASKVGECEGLVMFYIQYNGEKFYSMFEQSLEVDEYDELYSKITP